jgi:hypothetical protein
MSRVRITLYHHKIAAMGTPVGPVGKWTRQQVRLIAAEARVEAPKRTGRLAASIGDEYRGGGKYYVTASAPYVGYVVDGTKPHEIRAKNHRTLKFFWARVGRVVYPVRVWHPGTKPNNFLLRATDRVLGRHYVR